MLEALPFQPQGIPTLTMYERELDVGFIFERGLHSLPVLTAVSVTTADVRITDAGDTRITDAGDTRILG